jgi:uncharacterized protein YqjF (DUF2071 family)
LAQRFHAAEWRYRVMLDDAIDPAIVNPLASNGTELDCCNGKTFISIAG